METQEQMGKGRWMDPADVPEKDREEYAEVLELCGGYPTLHRWQDLPPVDERARVDVSKLPEHQQQAYQMTINWLETELPQWMGEYRFAVEVNRELPTFAAMFQFSF